MFIRVKKVKKRNGRVYEYAHLVHGIWRKRRLKKGLEKNKFIKFNNSVHKYKGIIGRVYRFENNKQINFDNFFDAGFESFVENNVIEDIYKKLIEYELVSRNFRKIGKVYSKSGIFVDLDRLIVHNGKSDAVIKLNDFSGYLCSLNLEDLFKIKKIENKYEGIYLVKKMKSLGIKISPENFFILANKLLEENK